MRDKEISERVPDLDVSATRSTSGGFATVEALKLVFLAVKYLLFRGRNTSRRRDRSQEPQDHQSYLSIHHERPVNLDSHTRGPKLTSPALLSALAASLFAVQNYAVRILDPVTFVGSSTQLGCRSRGPCGPNNLLFGFCCRHILLSVRIVLLPWEVLP